MPPIRRKNPKPGIGGDGDTVQRIPDGKPLLFSRKRGIELTIGESITGCCPGGGGMAGEHSKATFDNVVVPYLADAFALARWLAKDRADAEDIVQEACLRAFRAIDNYAGGNARAWVLTIVRRTAYSWLSKNRSSPLVALEDLNAGERVLAEVGGNQDLSGEVTPEAELIAKADAAQLEKAIASLPLEFRETLVLRDIQGLEYREIAEVTGIPLGTVMSRLARARRRLMQEIKAGR